eukprot:779405-Amphidinium_carterae.1
MELGVRHKGLKFIHRFSSSSNSSLVACWSLCNSRVSLSVALQETSVAIKTVEADALSKAMDICVYKCVWL